MVLDLLTRNEKGDLSFEESVALFFDIWPEKKTALADFFSVEDQFSTKKVQAALSEKLRELQEPVQTFESAYKEFVPSKHAEQPINVELLPDELRLEYLKRIPLIKEISHLQARLKYHEGQELTDMAARIVMLSDMRISVFAKVDHFLETGNLLKEEAERPAPIDASKLKDFGKEYELKLLRARRSKAKGRPGKIDEFNALDKQIKELEGGRYV